MWLSINLGVSGYITGHPIRTGTWVTAVSSETHWQDRPESSVLVQLSYLGRSSKFRCWNSESTSIFHLTIFFLLTLADILAVLLTDVLLLLQEKDQKYTFASVVCTFPGSISK